MKSSTNLKDILFFSHKNIQYFILVFNDKLLFYLEENWNLQKEINNIYLKNIRVN